jgi:hypothetical protein
MFIDREVDHEIDDLKKLLPSNSEVDPEILQKEEENAVKAIKVEVLGRELPDSFLHVKSKAEWKDLGLYVILTVIDMPYILCNFKPQLESNINYRQYLRN